MKIILDTTAGFKTLAKVVGVVVRISLCFIATVWATVGDGALHGPNESWWQISCTVITIIVLLRCIWLQLGRDFQL